MNYYYFLFLFFHLLFFFFLLLFLFLCLLLCLFFSFLSLLSRLPLDIILISNQVMNRKDLLDQLPKIHCDHHVVCVDCKLLDKHLDIWREIEDIPEYGEDEAIDICGKNRAHCEEYEEEIYTGRTCTVTIKEIFKLDRAGELLGGYVAFTFDNVEVKK